MQSIVLKTSVYLRQLLTGSLAIALAIMLSTSRPAVAAPVAGITTLKPTPAPLPPMVASQPLPPNAASQPQPAVEQPEATWRHSMARKPVPKGGCFTATYPATEWQEVPCSTNVPAIPHPPPHDIVGGVNGSDFVSNVPSPISSAQGSFYSVSGITDITSYGTSDTYSLQINSNVFPTILCPANSGCYGWEQHIYDSHGSEPGQIYIQYWLVNYPVAKGCMATNTCCPSSLPTVKGSPYTWAYSQPSTTAGGGCFINGSSHEIPAQPLADLFALVLTGGNSSTQQSTSLETQAGSSQVAQIVDPEDFLGIGSNWNTAEFNLFGLNGGVEAQVSGFAATIVTQLDVTLANGASTMPTCLSGSFTAESNSMNLISPCCPAELNPQPGPTNPAVNRIFVTESNAAGATSMCSCPSGKSWDPYIEACEAPVVQEPCVSGEKFCPRLDRCVSESEYALYCLIQKPTPP